MLSFVVPHLAHMNSKPVYAGTLLFEEVLELTRIEEFGYSWTDFVNRSSPLPSTGVRFNIHFEGPINAPLIKGKISGKDELLVRADGIHQLQLEAEVYTTDGALLFAHVKGTNDDGYLRLNLHITTDDARYQWLNNEQLLGIGEVDFSERKAKVSGYQLR